MLMQKLRIDDPLDAFAVHGACGFWGVLAAGLFGNPNSTGGNGLFYGGNQVGVQLFAALVIIVWVAGISAPVFWALKQLGMLRVRLDVEEIGMDNHEHSPSKCYAMEHSPSKTNATHSPAKNSVTSQSTAATEVDV